MATNDTAKLVAQLLLDDKQFQKGIRSAISGTDKLDKRLGSIGGKASQGLAAAGKNIERAFVGIGAAAVVGIGASVKVAADFESQLNTINTVAGLSKTELKGVGDSLREVAKTTGTDLDDLTAGFYDLVSAGVAAKDAMLVVDAANALAIGGLGTTAETIDLLTTAMNSYGLGASTAAKIADFFAESIAAGKVTASELAESFATIGPTAANAGIELQEVAAGYAVLTAQGVPAAEVATQMRAAVNGLLSPNAKLNKLQRQTGINFAKLAKEKGLAVALDRLRDESEKTGVPLQDLLGRVEAVGFALGVTGESADDYAKELEKVETSSGKAAQQMSERQQGLNFELDKLQANLKDAGITIGTALIPQLTTLAGKLTTLVTDNKDEIASFAATLPGAFDKALAFADKIPWTTIGDGLEKAATWAGKLFDAFLELPPEVQTTIIALAGLNKLSGGAVTDIASELAKGAIKGILGITAAVVNLKAATVVGGGPGVGPVPTPGPSGVTGLVKTLIGGAAAAAALTVKVATPALVAAIVQPMINDILIPNNPLDPKNFLPPEPKGGAKPFWELLGGGDREIENKKLQEQLNKAATASAQNITNERLESIKGYTADQSTAQSDLLRSSERNEDIGTASQVKGQQDAFAVRDAVNTKTGLLGTIMTGTKAAVDAVKTTTAATGQQTAFAIRDKDLSVTVSTVNNISNTISVSDHIKATARFHSVYRTAS